MEHAWDEKAVNRSEYRCTAEAPSLLGITSRIAAMTTIKGITELETEGLTYHEWRAHTEPVLFTAGYGIYFLRLQLQKEADGHMDKRMQAFDLIGRLVDEEGREDE
jgi:hypothetical protein